MKNKIFLFTIGLLMTLIVSCNDILDQRDATVINPAIWDSEQSVMLYVNSLYQNAPYTTNITTSSTPYGLHGIFTTETTDANAYLSGEYTYTSVSVFSSTYYVNIRNINIALERMAESSLSDVAKNRIIGQLYFLRAWSYWNLVVLYGGVPYVKNSVDPFVDDELTLDPPRNKTSECIQYISEDLDIAIATLPKSTTEYLNTSSEYARITRAAAAALKGRALLFYASPQFNPANDLTRWENAYQANLNAKTIAEEDGFALVNNLGTDPVSGNIPSIFLKEGTANKEALFVKAYDRTVSITHGWDNSVRPYVASISGGQGSNPTWDLALSFPMKNGLKITDEGSGYDAVYYWKNRDPRFYATIAYNGCNWPLAGMTGTTIWSYTGSDTEAAKGTRTGMYCRKATNALLDKSICNESSTDWVELRLAEVLLSLAECANETDRQSEAIALVGTIRQRAGIDAGDGLYGLKSSYADKTELTELIMNERFLEFAYENKRIWDMRRRKMYTQDLGSTPKMNGTVRRYLKTNIVYPPTAITPPQKATYLKNFNATTRNTIDLNTQYATYFISVVTDYVGDINYPIQVPERYDFFGIPQDILNRSQAIKQTQGWGDGVDEFNPYE
jgi:hypothetical protein